MSIDDPLRVLFRHPEVAALYDYWSARRDKDAIPLRDAFFRPELERWGRNVVLIRAKQNANMSYGFYGANFKEAFGLDMTGASLDALPKEQAATLKAEYRAVIQSRKPAWRHYTAWFSEQLQTWERLTLPTANQHGDIGLLLVAAYRLDGLPSDED